MLRFSTLFGTLALAAISAFGQAAAQPAGPQPVPQSIRPEYTLGANDQFVVRSNAEELNERPFRVEEDGFVTFPVAGRFQVRGLTVQALELELISRLRQFFVQPQVNITVTGFRNEPVSFFGAFTRPGLYPLTGSRTLTEMLSVVGGFQPNATRHLRITRRSEYGPIPLPSAIKDPVSGASTVEISLDNLLREINPAEDIVLQAYDRITLDQSLPVYVNGEVSRGAPVELAGRDSISVMQVLSMVGGFNSTARRDKVRVLRPVEGTGLLAPIAIDIERIIEGKDNDFPLFPNDILYIPQKSFLANLPQQALGGLLTSAPFVIISALLR